MSLERIQAQNNSRNNDQLIQGAELAAAGRTLGLSEEETLAMVSRQFRRQARADEKVTKSDILRQIAQSANTVTTDIGTPELKGVGYAGTDDVAFAFGEDIDYNRETGRTRADDAQTYRADDRGFTVDPETGLIRRETFEETRGDEVKLAPKSALSDALGDLRRAAAQQQAGLGGSIARVFGGSGVDRETANAIETLENYFVNERSQDARTGRALVQQDRARFNPEVMEANDFRADAEAQRIARDGYTFNGPGAMADEAIGRIAEIRNLGKIGESAQVIRTADDAILGAIARRQDGVFIDPRTGDTIAVQGPEVPAAIAGSRIPPTSTNSANVPSIQTATDFVNANVPDYREGQSFGDYPQVDITAETTNFANKLRDRYRQLGVNAQVPQNVRSIEELDRAAAAFSQYGVPKGKKLLKRDPENPNRNIPAGNDVVTGMLDTLRMSPNEQQRLANALFQLDAAKRSSVNQNPTGIYLSRATKQGPQMMGTRSVSDIRFDSPEAMITDAVATPIALQKKGTRIRVGTTPEGKAIQQDIVAAMRGLDNPDAQIPMIGMTRQMPDPNSTSSFKQEQVYNRTGQTNPRDIANYLVEQAVARAKGGQIDEDALKNNIVNAVAVQRRADADLARRAEAMSQIIGSLPPSARRSRLGRA